MNRSVQLFNVAKACRQLARPASTDAVAAKSDKLKTIQKQLQVDDGVPIHLKRGFGDKLLYQFTVLCTLVGLGLSGQTIFKLTFKD
ncbi:hypothetical protein JTB14_013459 [Gonioctena quinquepunctata]|nr:hypothetical protein JTB14_013459 [Gonioctena quinquepunctata]